ncbi:MAG: F0F1 ATP synthase subunit B [Desulfobulbus sp.]|jgi:F-type H+-transporting ATPase subunit b|nr:F0F1 ATP synthase subunit B [Desulfobulbus sp.]
MLFDWFTVVAQLVNFLILVWLMKRFLYKPILNAIDSREKLVAQRLADAKTQRTEAEQERETFRQKNEAFDEQRDELMRTAKDEAKEERLRLLEETRQAADDLRRKRHEALVSEQQSLHEEIIHRTRDEVFAIARKTLADLAGATLEERITDAFSRRLRELDSTMKENLTTAIKTSPNPVLVRSAFTLPSEQQAVIRLALKEAFGVEPEFRFETSPEVISGIELTTNGQKVAWSIQDYLVSLKKSVSEQLKETATPQVDSKADELAKSEMGSNEVEVVS